VLIKKIPNVMPVPMLSKCMVNWPLWGHPGWGERCMPQLQLVRHLQGPKVLLLACTSPLSHSRRIHQKVVANILWPPVQSYFASGGPAANKWKCGVPSWQWRASNLLPVITISSAEPDKLLLDPVSDLFTPVPALTALKSPSSLTIPPAITFPIVLPVTSSPGLLFRPQANQ
jgi:hypothetical protein